AGAFHRHDCVDDGDDGLEQQKRLNQHAAEVIVIAAGLDVPPGLAPAGHTAEHVLDRDREQKLTVGFELRQINDRVRFQRGAIDYQIAEDLAPRILGLDRILEFHDRHAQVIQVFEHAELLQIPGERAPGGGITYEWPGAVVEELPADFEDHGRVRLGG